MPEENKKKINPKGFLCSPNPDRCYGAELQRKLARKLKASCRAVVS